MLSQTHIDTVKATIPVLASAGTAITEHFYKRMFTHNPELKDVFNMSHQATGRQPAALFNAIAAYATHIDNLEVLTGAVMRIAHKHTSFNIQPNQYPIVGHHLIETLRELLGDAFTPDIEEAWGAAYQQLADLFIQIEGDLYKANAAKQGGWDDFRTFRVAKKHPESELVTSFVLEPTDGGAVVDYVPGQYLGIKLHPSNHEFDEIRQYSLSTAPNGKSYRISVKRELSDVKNGVVSNYLHESVQEGDEVALMPPAGDFHYQERERPVVLISAGVGLTPMNSMLDTLAAQGSKNPIFYLHACRNPQQHSFAEHVASLADTLALTYYTWYETDAPENADHVLAGQMQLAQVAEVLPLAEGDFYLCGPVGFMMFAKEQLLSLGVSDDRIHYEVFGPHQSF
ncbi:NO-inducible flavohemoprotein [Marinomonas gallaica]|uniref:NO-inducible flavohemoprotein n=1 Tax=Marinomonas gallaica TaxID=1806667 RepID=UPI003A8D7738